MKKVVIYGISALLALTVLGMQVPANADMGMTKTHKHHCHHCRHHHHRCYCRHHHHRHHHKMWKKHHKTASKPAATSTSK